VPSNKKIIVRSKEQHINELAAMLARGVLEMFDAQEKQLGVYGAKALYMHTLAKVIDGIVYKSLSDIPDDIKGDQAKHDWCYASYEDAKLRVQSAVSAGFQAAMLTFSGKSCEYYCLVKPVPESVNKQPC